MEIHLRHFKLKKSSVDNNEFTELSVVVDVAVDNSGQACDPGAEDNKHCALVSSVRSARRLTADQTWRPAPSFSGRKAVVQSEGGRQLTRLLLPHVPLELSLILVTSTGGVLAAQLNLGSTLISTPWLHL